MAIKEIKILKSVEFVFVNKSINVAWSNQIVKDGTVISESVERTSYLEEDKDRFVEDFGKDSKKYISLIW